MEAQKESTGVRMVRPDWDTFVRQTTRCGGYLACTCGHILETFGSIRTHWQAGHFDTVAQEPPTSTGGDVPGDALSANTIWVKLDSADLARLENAAERMEKAAELQSTLGERLQSLGSKLVEGVEAAKRELAHVAGEEKGQVLTADGSAGHVSLPLTAYDLLTGQRGRAVKLLRAMEWGTNHQGDSVCPVCDGERYAGWHEKDCALAALLREVGE